MNSTEIKKPYLKLSGRLINETQVLKEGEKPSKTKSTTFFSIRKNARILFTRDQQEGEVEFRNNLFETNDSVALDILRTHGANKIEYWEGAYPEEIISKMDYDKKNFIYTSDDIFDIPEN